MDPSSDVPEMPDLMIPGPGQLHDEELEVLGRQLIAHYGDVWTAMHNETVELLGRLLGAADPPYVMPGTGTACLDAAVMNLFETGEKVAVANTGFFGNRLVEIANANGLDVVEVPVEIGAAIDVQRISEAAKGATGILTVHVETSTGVRHPIEEIAKVALEQGAIYLVDGIASAGGELVDVDSMRLGTFVTATQKGLDTPPGLGIVALGPAGRVRIESRSRPPHSWYLDLKRWDRYRKEWSWHPHPVTMPANLVMVLLSSLRRIVEAGIDTVVKARADLATYCREGLRSLGLEPVPQPGVEANLVVAAWASDPGAIQKQLLSKGIMISGGLEPVAGKTIRIGLVGRTATYEMVDRVLEGVAAVVRQ
jgi:alanine-glyoxylate transaminase/serine-glyoxylate transaminase/serine-pyruvate transaminase